MNEAGPAGRRALILGGSGGIGAQISRMLGAGGMELLIHGGHNRHRLDQLCAELHNSGSKCTGFLFDCGDIHATCDRVADLGPLDVMVIAFGPFLTAALSETGVDDWERLVRLNLALPGALVSQQAPQMAARGFGRIILFGGTDTDLPQAFRRIPAYSAAKAGLSTLARSAAAVYGAQGVTVNVICPGPVATEYQSEDEKLHYKSILPDNRMIDPQELTPVVDMLLHSQVVNGVTLRVDMGWDRRH